MIRAGTQWGAVRRLRAGNLMVSNVPGPNVPLFFAGMRLRALHPLGPVVDGVALNITVQSYRDQLDFGLIAGANVLPDVNKLARMFPEEFEALEAAFGLAPRVGAEPGPEESPAPAAETTATTH